jgi:regulator of protease activity HflC (stomatin/prohibitin superfamily)
MEASVTKDPIEKYLAKNWGKLLVVALAIILIPMSVVIVGAGKRAVVLTFGAATGKIFGEGLSFKIPIVQTAKIMDVRVQKEECKANAASKDLQQVTSMVAVNYNLTPTMVSELYQRVGLDYKERIIDPAIQEAFKAVTSRFTAEELITRRQDVREQTIVLLQEKMKPFGINIDALNIMDFDFSKVFNDAIEAKVTTEQQALAAKNKLKQVEYEAQQKIVEAQGKAKALQIEGNAISSNPAIVQMRAVERWDGKFPEYWGSGALPFINLK